MLKSKMNIKNLTLSGLLLLFLATGCDVATSQSGLPEFIDKGLQDAGKQYKYLLKQTPEDKLPRSFEKGELITSDSRWWCSGFYPGTLLYLFEETQDKELYNEALEKLKLLEKEQFNKSTHDLGFMMYCSYGNAYRLNPSDKYKDILLNSARSLSSRFNEKVGCIRSWNSKEKDKFLVIIDNMMNLELLFWATKATGDSSFYNMAVTHANTTMDNHFRPDNSSFHLVNYHPETGTPQVKETVQGAADESAWARGQAWGLYGFTVMYRETKDEKYLDMANRIAEFILTHPNLPKDKIPYWDFDAPEIPDAPRDASAGAIMASALIELAGFNENKIRENYLEAAETMLQSLSSPTYRASYGDQGGFILKHSVGSIPHNLEVDAPLTYADYYYVEALTRYKKNQEDILNK